MVLGTAMLVKGLASIGSFVKDAAVEAVTRPFKDAFQGVKDEITGSFGEIGQFASGAVKNVVRPDQALKIRLSSAFEQKLMSVREPILNVSEFKVEQIRGDDPLKSIDKIHANIVGYLNIVNKNTAQTFEYVRSSVKQQNVRVEDIKKSTAVIHKSYNDLSERITKLNIRVSDLERKKRTPGLGAPVEKLKSSDQEQDPNILSGLLSGLGSTATGVAAGAGGGLLARALKGMMRGGGVVTPLIAAQMLKDFAAKDVDNKGRSEARRILLPWMKMFGLSTDDKETPEDKAAPPPWEKDPEKNGGNSQWERERQQRVIGRIQSVEDAREKGVGGSVYRAFHPDTPHSFNERFGSWDKNQRTGTSIEKYELKKQSISMQSASDFKMSAQQSIELKARSIVLKATDCISLDAPKIIFSTCPTIKSSDGLQKLISQCISGEDDTIPENAKPTSGELPGKRTRMPRGMGGLGSGMGGGGLSGGAGGAGMGRGGGLNGGGAGGAGMGGGGLSGGRVGMGLGGGTGGGTTGGGFAGGGGGGGFTGRGASGSWGGIPDTAIDRDPNTPAFGSSFGQGRSFAGAGGSGGAFGGRTGVYNTPGGAGMVYPSAGRRRDSTGGPPRTTTTTNNPPPVPLIEETYPGLGKGGTGPDPLIPSRDDPTKPADPNDTRKGITLEDIRRAVYNPGPDTDGNQALVDDRKGYADEIKNNPRVRDMIAAMGETEVSGQPAAHSGHVEAMMNRISDINEKRVKEGKSKITLEQALTDPKYARYYDPYRTGSYQRKLASLTDADRQKWNPIIDKVVQGANTTDLATGTASGTDASERSDFAKNNGFFGQGMGKGRIITLDKEHFGEEAGTGGWRERMRRRMEAAPKRKPGELLRTQDVDPSKYVPSPNYQSNRDREAREGKTTSSTTDQTSREGFVDLSGKPTSGNVYSAPRPDNRDHSGFDEHYSDGYQYPNKTGGKVLYNNWNKGYGANIVIEGDDGIIRRYAVHGSTVGFKVGTRVEKGTIIGTISRGHNHYEEIPKFINGKPNPKYQEFLNNAKTNTFTSTSRTHGRPDTSGTIDPRQRRLDAEAAEKKAKEDAAKANTAPTVTPSTANTTPAPTVTPSTANTTPAPTANTAPVPTANTAPRPPSPVGSGSQGNAAAQENEKAGRPFWQLGSAKAAAYPAGTVLSDATPDAVQAGQQYAGMTMSVPNTMTIPPLSPSTGPTTPPPVTPATTTTARPPPPFLPPGMTPHSGPQYNPPPELGVRTEIPKEGLAPLTKGGPRIMPDGSVVYPDGKVIPPQGSTISAPAPKGSVVPIPRPRPGGVGPPLDIRSDEQKAQDEPVHPNQPAMPTNQAEVNKKLAELAGKSKEKLNWKGSVVDMMKVLGLDSSRKARIALAKQLGYAGPNNSRSRNIWLQQKLRSNLIAQPVKDPPLDIRSDVQKEQDEKGTLEQQLGTDDIITPKSTVLSGTPYGGDTAGVQGAPGTQSGPAGNLEKQLGGDDILPTATFDERFAPSGRSRDTVLSGTPYGGDTAGVQGVTGGPSGPSGNLSKQLGSDDIPKPATFDDRFGFPTQTTPTDNLGDQLGIGDIGKQSSASDDMFRIKGTGTVLSDASDGVEAGQQYAGMKNVSRANLGPSGSSGIEPQIGNTKDFTFYYPGASGPKGMEGPYEAARSGLTGGVGPEGPEKLNAIKTLDDYRLGRSTYVTVASPINKMGQHIKLGDIEYRSPIDGKIYKLSNVPGYTHDTGGAFTSDTPRKRDIAVGNFTGINPDTGLPFTDKSAHDFSIKYHKQYAPGTFDRLSSQAPIPPVDTPDKAVPNLVHQPTDAAAVPAAQPSTAIPHVPQIDQTKAAPAVVEATRTKDIEVDREKKRADDEKKKAEESKEKEKQTRKEKDDTDTKTKKDNDAKPEEKIVKPTHDPETERPDPHGSGYGAGRKTADSTAEPMEMQE